AARFELPLSAFVCSLLYSAALLRSRRTIRRRVAHRVARDTLPRGTAGGNAVVLAVLAARRRVAGTARSVRCRPQRHAVALQEDIRRYLVGVRADCRGVLAVLPHPKAPA